MSDFKSAYDRTNGNEGGYANNPADAGGETYKGISRKNWGSWRGWVAIDRIKTKLVAMPDYGSPSYHGWVKVFNRTAEQDAGLQAAVRDFFKVNFWDRYRIGEINNQALANWLYDHAANGGGQGIKWMQEAADIEADGAIGPESIRVFNGQDAGTLLKKAEIVAAWYRIDKVADKPSQAQFLNSWLARDGVDADVIKQARAFAKDGLSPEEVEELKSMVKADAINDQRGVAHV